jgi:acetylornithine/succinyldiaminopimelate/putrescine aminotransferase/predicted amino acid dehydrogenase
MPSEVEAHHKPCLDALLGTFGLDVTYERGRGNFLYYRDPDGREVEVLDLVGGFGTLLLGHSHPALVAEARRLLARGTPHHAQGSRADASQRLARALSRRAGGDFTAVFASTGAEAVEAALKHAMLETGGRTFIALERAFHGKTLGALQLTAGTEHREPFQIDGLRVVRVPPNSLDDLETAVARAEGAAGFVFEPILGEGGVRPLDRAFLRRARDLCRGKGIPFIADECQTGVGRTGTFLACQSLEIEPDYVVLSKALGGGLAKISALLVRSERYVPEFDFKQSSTYADDAYSASIALKTLELLDAAALARGRDLGERLRTALGTLHNRYPEILVDVRGRGLMIGVEFARERRSTSFLLDLLASQDHLVFLLAGYLLRAHAIRVAPTLGDPFTLRLQPSLLLEEAQIARIVAALDDVCARLRAGDTAGLTAPFGEPARAPGPLRVGRRFVAYPDAGVRTRLENAPSVRAGWLCHLINTDHLTRVEPSLERVDSGRREHLLDRLAALAVPVVLNPLDLRSRTGVAGRFYPILLPVTSCWMKRALDSGDVAPAQALVERGIETARALGCSAVALGQYTSIVTRNGITLSVPGLGLSTGNSYTVALAIQAILNLHRCGGVDPARSVLAVAGASGNIGRACAELLAPHYRRTILLGTPRAGSELRLQELAATLPRAELTQDPLHLRVADAVVCAVNAVDAPFGPEHFGPNCLVCDLSIPPALRPGTAQARPDLRVISGGVARLPFGERLDVAAFPLPPGRFYACMVEGMLLAFDNVRDASFTGAVSADRVRRIEAMAAHHGFGLADIKGPGHFEAAPADTIHVLPG